MAVLDILIEVFTWTGLGAAALLLILAVVLWAADGSWLPARGVVEGPATGAASGDLTVRWFDADGDVNEAALTDVEAREVGERTMVDLWYRHGWQGRMRLRPTSPAVVSVLRLAAGFGGLGVVGLVTGWVLLFTRG